MKSLLQNDLPASVVVFLVALPLCLGIALGSGAPPMAGVIAGVVGGVVVGALSGSPISVSGPAAGLTSIVLMAISDLGSFPLFLTAVVLAGLFQLLFGLAKLGTVGHYVPNTVIKGMMAAIGIILIMKQIPHLVGYDVDFMGDENFVQPTHENTFTGLYHALWRITPTAAAVGALSLLLLVLADKIGWAKTSVGRIFPAALVAVLAGVGLSFLLEGLGTNWVLTAEHRVELGDGFNTWITPDWSGIQQKLVWTVAITLALVASLESLLSIEAADKLDPLKRVTPTNRELMAQGAGNVLSGLIGGLPVTSVVVRSSANVNAGAKSKASAVLHGLLLMLCVFAIPGVLNMIPKAALASILILTGYKLANVALFKEYYSRGKQQFIPFVVTIVAIIFTDLLIGILVGILVGLYFVMRSNFRSAMIMVEDGDKYLIRFSREVSFLNKAKLVDYLQKVPDNSAVLIDPLRNEFMDRDIIETVNDFIASSQARGIRVYIMRDKRQDEVFNDPYRLEMK